MRQVSLGRVGESEENGVKKSVVDHQSEKNTMMMNERESE